MKRILLIVLIVGLNSMLAVAHNAFTIHDNLSAPVHVYYDSELLPDHILISIYPDPEFILLSPAEMKDWIDCGFPICGQNLTILSEAENNCFYVQIGSGHEIIRGYVEKGRVAVNTRNYDDAVLYLYDSPTYEGVKIYAGHGGYAQILKKAGKWFYVRIQYAPGLFAFGWLSPDKQCPNYFTTCG